MGRNWNCLLGRDLETAEHGGDDIVREIEVYRRPAPLLESIVASGGL